MCLLYFTTGFMKKRLHLSPVSNNEWNLSGKWVYSSHFKFKPHLWNAVIWGWQFYHSLWFAYCTQLLSTQDVLKCDWRHCLAVKYLRTAEWCLHYERHLTVVFMCLTQALWNHSLITDDPEDYRFLCKSSVWYLSDTVVDTINPSAAGYTPRDALHSKKMRSVTIQSSCFPCGCHHATHDQVSAAPPQGGYLPPPAGGPGNELFLCWSVQTAA